MTKQLRRLLFGLAMVMVCLTGLLAVSALVPDVGCEQRPSQYLLISTVIQLTAPDEVNPGQSFTVSGTLYKILGTNPLTARWEPFPQQKINLNVAMFTTDVYTDNTGSFSAEFTVKNPGVYQVIAYYPGDRMSYYADYKVERYLTITGIIPVPVNYRWLIYVAIALGLALISYILYRWLNHSQEKRLAGLKVKSLANKKKSRRLRPWLIGFLTLVIIFGFFFALWPRAQLPVRHEFVPSYIETRTKLETPARVKPEQEFTIKGKLVTVEEGDERPLPSQSIHIMKSPQFGTSTEITQLVTDNNGSFSTTIILEKTGVFEIAAVFDDTGDLYYKSSDSRDVIVGNTPKSLFSDWNSPGWLAIIIGVPLVAIALIIIIRYYRHYRRYRKNLPPKEKVLKQRSVKPSPLPSPPQPVMTKHDPSLRIDFPQIAGDFPDVWGRGDELLIVVRKVAGNGQTGLDIELEPDVKQEANLDEEGSTSQEYIYDNTGEYEVKAAFTGKPLNGYRPASRSLRIVDYREEIVRLYNEMVVMLKTRGMTLTPKMTAREVEQRLKKTFPAVSGEFTDSLVSIFEEANYSLHPISRPEYENMYLAIQEVEQYVITK